ncbi:MAG: transposase [Ruminococcus sp.]|nr:transposase [Ruminococcus sp.]
MDNKNEYKIRKQIRMPEYDYNSNGAYFITICTKNRKPLLSKISVGTTIGRPPDVILTKYGRITEDAIRNIEIVSPSVHIDNFVIMPNHIHLLLFLYCDDGRAMLVPTISRIIQQLKGTISKRIGHSVWHPRFYDRVIRSERDYREIYQYIDNNPARWAEDKYYMI